jgi:hypothetical protein
MSEPVLKAALRHASRGRRVLPCCPATKAPLTSRGFKDASADPTAIRRWFTGGTAMLGIATGAVSRLVALDVDGEIGADTLHDLEREHGKLPPTASATTPHGEHLYFTHPGDEVRCSAGVLGPRLDLRGDGGYVIVPPSVTTAGGKYVIDCEVPLAPMPAWLLALIRGRRNGAPAGNVEEPGLIPVGRRHGMLVRFCGSLRAMGLSEAAIVECGTAFLRHQVVIDPDKPIDMAAAERTMRSVATYPPRPNWRP